MDHSIEDIDSLTNVGADLPTDAPAMPTIEDYNRERAARIKTEEANKKLYARTKAAEEAKKQSATITNPQDTPKIDDEMLELRLQGYTREDAEFVIKNGGIKSLEDKNSLVSLAINQKREQARAENAANAVGQDTSSLSEVERKYTPEQLKNMSAKELENILPKN